MQESTIGQYQIAEKNGVLIPIDLLSESSSVEISLLKNQGFQVHEDIISATSQDMAKHIHIGNRSTVSTTKSTLPSQQEKDKTFTFIDFIDALKALLKLVLYFYVGKLLFDIFYPTDKAPEIKEKVTKVAQVTAPNVDTALGADEDSIIYTSKTHGYYLTGVGAYKCNEFYSKRMKSDLESNKKDYDLIWSRAETKSKISDWHEWNVISKAKTLAEIASLDYYDTLSGTPKQRCKVFEDKYYGR